MIRRTEYGLAEPMRVGMTELPDGRRLGWAEWGPPDGGSVLWTHGEEILRSLLASGR